MVIKIKILTLKILLKNKKFYKLFLKFTVYKTTRKKIFTVIFKLITIVLFCGLFSTGAHNGIKNALLISTYGRCIY